MVEEEARVEMGLVGRAVRVELEGVGRVDGFMSMMSGIRLILGGYRTQRIFLGAWRLMLGGDSWMGTGGIKGVGAIGLLLEMGCELRCFGCLLERLC